MNFFGRIAQFESAREPSWYSMAAANTQVRCMMQTSNVVSTVLQPMVTELGSISYQAIQSEKVILATPRQKVFMGNDLEEEAIYDSHVRKRFEG